MCSCSDSGFPLIIFLKHKKTSLKFTKKIAKSESEIPQVSYAFSVFSGNYNNLTDYGNCTAVLQWHKNSEMLWHETEKQSTVII